MIEKNTHFWIKISELKTAICELKAQNINSEFKIMFFVAVILCSLMPFIGIYSRDYFMLSLYYSRDYFAFLSRDYFIFCLTVEWWSNSEVPLFCG